MPSGIISEAAEIKVPVQFAILLEEHDPLSGEVTCAMGRSCKILENEYPQIDLSIKVFPNEGYAASELQLYWAPTGCSFPNGQSTVKFRDERQFDFYQGLNGIEVPLVLKAKVKMGRILLIYP